MNLTQRIDTAITNFRNELLDAVKHSTAEELFAIMGGNMRKRPVRTMKRAPAANYHAKADGRQFRRSPEELTRAATAIAKLLKGHKDGMNAEELKRSLKISGKRSHGNAFAKPVKIALAQKLITKKGEKRATRYYAT